MSRNMSMRSTTPCSTNWQATRGLRCRLACARGARGASVSAGCMQRVWVDMSALTEKHIKRSKHVQQKIILISAGVEPLRCLYVPKLPQPQRWGVIKTKRGRA